MTSLVLLIFNLTILIFDDAYSLTAQYYLRYPLQISCYSNFATNIKIGSYAQLHYHTYTASLLLLYILLRILTNTTICNCMNI